MAFLRPLLVALTLACKDYKWLTLEESLLSLGTAEVCSVDPAVICLWLIINITRDPGSKE